MLKARMKQRKYKKRNGFSIKYSEMSNQLDMNLQVCVQMSTSHPIFIPPLEYYVCD